MSGSAFLCRHAGLAEARMTARPLTYPPPWMDMADACDGSLRKKHGCIR